MAAQRPAKSGVGPPIRHSIIPPFPARHRSRPCNLSAQRVSDHAGYTTDMTRCRLDADRGNVYYSVGSATRCHDAQISDIGSNPGRSAPLRDASLRAERTSDRQDDADRRTDQPRRGDVRPPCDRHRGRGPCPGTADPPRHPRRPRRLDAGHHQGHLRLRDTRDRLCLAEGRPGGVGRSDHPAGEPRRGDGSGDGDRSGAPRADRRRRGVEA